MLEFVRYRNVSDIPREPFQELTGYLIELHYFARDQLIPASVRGIVGILPTPRYRAIESLQFYSLNTSRTLYGALRDMEQLLGEFYRASGILPIVTPLPARLIHYPGEIPPFVKRQVHSRGALLYVP
jgi:hypothetical protein